MPPTFFYFIPANPYSAVTSPALHTAAAQLKHYLPAAKEITVGDFGQTRYFYPPSDLISAQCPRCKADLLTDDVWQDLLDIAFDSYYLTLEAQMPCCGETVSLNDLEFDSPAGFAHWCLIVQDPGADGVTDAQLKTLQDTLGCKLLVVKQSL